MFQENGCFGYVDKKQVFVTVSDVSDTVLQSAHLRVRFVVTVFLSLARSQTIQLKTPLPVKHSVQVFDGKKERWWGF